jgi:ribonuclease E
MLINRVEGKECRIAVIDDGALEELYLERVSSASRVGNIYKGRVVNIEASIQAAFIDFGSGKNGFLHISDLHPQYFRKGGKSPEAVGRKRAHRDRPPIQECLRRGQEVVVQMIKEGIGTKGPTMTSYLSIPGRLLVMMPGMSRLGVSRKIEDDRTREETRKLLEAVKPPPDMGFIVRTAGAGRPARDLRRDLNFLLRLWKTVSQRIRTARAPAEIYQESDLVTRTIRDVYNSDIDRVICDTADTARHVREFLRVAMPRTRHVIEVYTGAGGLFHDFGIEEQIEKVYARRVEMPSGGSLVIDQAEALVAIDVNSGRYREHADPETTALKINQEAAAEIARQLRLRDLGGVIVIDFIDLRAEKNRRAVERALRDALKPDRAKSRILRMSRFGVIEMTRQRIRPSLESSVYRPCATCGGTGIIKSEESLALAAMRAIQRAAGDEDIARVEVAVTPPVAHQLSNYHRKQITRLENDTQTTVVVRADPGLAAGDTVVTCQNARGAPVAWDAAAPGAPGKGKLPTVPLAEFEAAQKPPPPEAKPAGGEPPAGREEAEAAAQAPPAPQKKKKKRRSHRRGRKKAQPPEAAEAAAETVAAPADTPAAAEAAPASDQPPEPAQQQKKAKSSRRSRRRRSRSKKKKAGTTAAAE